MRAHRKSSQQSLAVLFVLLEQSRTWRHGYDLAKATNLQSGTLYPILARLEDRGYLESKWLESTQVGRPPRHAYRLTAVGVAFARETVRKYEEPHYLPVAERIKS
jgi:PadR family transcriptional regulator PadR